MVDFVNQYNPQPSYADKFNQYGQSGYQPVSVDYGAGGSLLNDEATFGGASLSPYSTTSADSLAPDIGKGLGGGGTADKLGTFGKITSGIKAATGAFNVALGFKALKEQSKANQFSQNLARLNIANQAGLLSERRDTGFRQRSARQGTGEGTAGYTERLAGFQAKNPISSTIG